MKKMAAVGKSHFASKNVQNASSGQKICSIRRQPPFAMPQKQPVQCSDVKVCDEVQWNPVNKVTNGPKKFGRINR